MSPNARFLYFLATTAFELILIIILLFVLISVWKNEYRTRLWEDGGFHGWNSDPRERVYYYANYKEPPPVPQVWDEALHQYHLFIAIVTGVVWIARIRTQVYGLDLVGKIGTGAIYDLLLLAMWSYSAGLQSAEDISDPAHLSLRPWYLQRNCREAGRQDLRACKFVKASYTLTWFIIIWLCLRFMTVCMYSAYLFGVHKGERVVGKGTVSFTV